MYVKIQNVSIHVQNEIRVHLLLTARLLIMNQNAHAQMDSLAPHLQTAGHVSNIYIIFLGTDMVKVLTFVDGGRQMTKKLKISLTFSLDRDCNSRPVVCRLAERLRT